MPKLKQYQHRKCYRQKKRNHRRKFPNHWCRKAYQAHLSIRRHHSRLLQQSDRQSHHRSNRNRSRRLRILLSRQPLKVQDSFHPTSNAGPAPEPAFDVGYWVDFAKAYAKSVGLELDSEAVSCWDNPTIASSASRYLERDLCGLLNKYSRDADITAVWIWAEPRTESSWDIYIGYA